MATPMIEVRIYKIKSGLRDRFVQFFETKAIPAQEAVGMRIEGQFISLDDEDTFVWLRVFPDEEARQRMTDEFYGGSTWKHSLRDEAMSMVVDYSNVHVVTPTARSRIR